MEPRGQHSKVQRGPPGWGYGASSDPLESFRELGELMLVGDRNLDSRCRDTRAKAGGALAGDTHSFRQGGFNPARRFTPRFSAGAGPARGPLRGSNGQAPWGELTRQAPPPFRVGYRKHRARRAP